MTTTKMQFGTQLDAVLLERLRSTVVGLQQLDPWATVGTFVGEAIMAGIRAAEDEFHNGQPWPDAAAPPRRGPRTAGAPAGGKAPFGTQLDTELLRRMRNTVVGLQRLDPAVTVATFVGEAIALAIQAAEAEFHNGQPWPAAAAPPRRGPRVGT